MTTHGQIGELHGDTEDWPSYMEWLECYFAANNVEESGKQCAICLSCYGATTYSLIRSLAALRKPNDISYQESVKRVTAHFNLKPSKIVARFKFNLTLRPAPTSAQDGLDPLQLALVLILVDPIVYAHIQMTCFVWWLLYVVVIVCGGDCI